MDNTDDRGVEGNDEAVEGLKVVVAESHLGWMSAYSPPLQEEDRRLPGLPLLEVEALSRRINLRSGSVLSADLQSYEILCR